MTIIAIIFLAIMVFESLYMPFVFGNSRGTYTPQFWLMHVLIHAPLMWLLWQIAFVI